MYAIETARDENTGLEMFLIVNTQTGVDVDRAYDREDAEEICDYYNDREAEYDGQPDEFTEWMDFDPDC